MGGGADDALATQREILLQAVAFEVVLAVEQAGHDGVNGLVGGTADHGVHFGDLLLDLAAVALGQAAGDDDLQIGVLLLVGAGFEDVFDGLGLGALDEAAGVDQNDVGLTQLGHSLVPGRQQDVDHAVQIDLVLRAAKGNTCNFHKGMLLSFFYNWVLLHATSPSMLRIATSPCRGGLGSPRKVSGFARGSPTRKDSPGRGRGRVNARRGMAVERMRD